MTLKRLLVPTLVLGSTLVMASGAFAQTAINCGLSFPSYGAVTLAATPRGASTGHTEPIAAGAPTDTGSPVATAPNGVPAAPAALGYKTAPPWPGGGGVRVTCYNGGTAGTATDPGVVALTLALGVPITNTTTSHPSTNTQIRIINPTGDFAAAACPGAGAPCVNINLLQNTAGNVVVGLSNAAFSTGINFTPGTTSSFDIVGALVSLNGRTTPVVATLTSTGGVTVGPAASGPGANVGAASLQVIDAVLAGLGDPTSPSALPNLAPFNAICGAVTVPCPGGAAVLNSAGGVVKGSFVLRIPEAFPNMFRDASQYNGPGLAGVFPNSGSSDSQVNIVLNNIPSGLNISGCNTVLTNEANTVLTVGAPVANFTNITAASPVVTVNFTNPVDQDNIDALWLLCSSVTAGSATLPLPSTSVTAQATLAPVGTTAFSGTGGANTTLTAGQVPRFQQLLVPSTPVTVVVFPSTKTDLLLSFAFVGPGYNTGLSIANTTVDPFGTGGGGAPASEGTLSFLLVKNDGTTKSYTTTSGSPGSGLTSAGVLKAGSTYVVNLSELLSASSFGTSFTGYVFVTANFTNAHGAATIYTTSTAAAALSSPVLVVVSGNGTAISSASPRTTPESLGQ
jgi:hypothetical protein